jgi:site-specific DNA-methyltransferase (adenine-specific)
MCNMNNETWVNKLWFGDNLEVLRNRDEFPNDFIDLIYLDPPFNSNATYNMLFKETSGDQSEAQIHAFEDTWQWVTGQTEAVYNELIRDADYPDLANLIQSLVTFLGRNAMMAYIVMMAVRLKELHRILKPTGSLYLHCDPTASHYIKLVLDGIFGFKNYRNEIIWKRYSSHGNVYKRCGRIHDIVFWYSKTNNFVWNQQYTELDETYIDNFFKFVEPETGRRYRKQNVLNPNKNRPNLRYKWNGFLRVWKWTKEKMQKMHDENRLAYSSNGYPSLKQYLDETKGQKIQDIWLDVGSLSHSGEERLGYPTQKPEALLERIIEASSNEGDLLLDPFCGCGTTIAVAERLKRRWIGIDITWLSVDLMERRLKDTFGSELSTYEVEGAPKDIASAINLADRDKYQFEWWAVTQIGARPYQGKKKGADTGIDGIMYFQDDLSTRKQEKIVVQVKGGKHVGSPHIDQLIGVVEKEKAAIGIYISITEPTRNMKKEANKAGVYESSNGRLYPRIQILTIEEIMDGKQPEYPYRDTGGFTPFKRAVKKDKENTKKESKLL